MRVTLVTPAARLGAALLLAGALVTAGCGGSDKKESTTPEKAIAEGQGTGQAAQADGEATAGGELAAGEAAGGEAGGAQAPAGGGAAPVVSGGGTPQAEVQNALALTRRGQHEQAIAQAKLALRKNEKYVPAMEVMARAYYQLNKLEFAESVCDIALSIEANSGECYNLKGFVALKNGNDPLALELFKKGTQVAAGYGPLWQNLGVQYLKVKNYDQAIPTLERATQLMPNKAEAQLNMGSAYRGAGQVAKAQAAYQEALRLRPNYSPAYFNLGILFLDAQEYPGMAKLQQLNTAITHFNKYKRSVTYLAKDDPADSYIVEAQKAIEREQRRLERETKRQQREAAKGAPQAKPAAGGQ